MFTSDECKKLIQGVNAITIESDLQQEDFVMEEASEFTKAVTKVHRRKGSQQDVIEEACDVVAASMVLFCRYNIDMNWVEEYCKMKWKRAIERFEDHGET